MFSAFNYLVQVFFSNLSKRFSPNPDRFTRHFFDISVNSHALHSFSADSSGQQTPLKTDSVQAACNVAVFFSFATPDRVATVESSVFNAFEGRTGGRTRF